MRVEFFGRCRSTRSDEFDPLTGNVIRARWMQFDLYPANAIRHEPRTSLEPARSAAIKRGARRARGLLRRPKGLSTSRRSASACARTTISRCCRKWVFCNRHRELLTPSSTVAEAGRAAVLPHRLFPEGFSSLIIDESHATVPAGRRHVQRRPRAQDRRWWTLGSGCRRRSTTGRRRFEEFDADDRANSFTCRPRPAEVRD